MNSIDEILNEYKYFVDVTTRYCYEVNFIKTEYKKKIIYYRKLFLKPGVYTPILTTHFLEKIKQKQIRPLNKVEKLIYNINE